MKTAKLQKIAMRTFRKISVHHEKRDTKIPSNLLISHITDLIKCDALSSIKFLKLCLLILIKRKKKALCDFFFFKNFHD